MNGMDVEILRLAAAPTTRALVEGLAEQLGEGDPRALSEQALASGELRAALNFALAGADGASPSFDGVSCNGSYCHGATLLAGGSNTAPAWPDRRQLPVAL